MAVTVQERTPSTVFPETFTASGWCPVMVIDPQPLVRAGLVSLIAMHLGPTSVCYSGTTAREAILASRNLDGACAILGTRGSDPCSHDIESVAALAMNSINVLVVVDEPSPEGMEALTVAGAKGYLDRNVSPSEFIRSVRTLAAGHPCFPVLRLQHERRMLTQVRLSSQERRALVLYASGLTQDVVARRMGIAPNTVKHYLDRVREKYNSVGVHARTKLELHALARAEGLLP